MAFNSLIFGLFFVCVLFVHALPLQWHARKSNLLLASYLFYAAWNPPFLALLWISTLTDWFAGKRLVLRNGQAILDGKPVPQLSPNLDEH